MPESQLQEKESKQKRFYLKWPWNVVVYIVLAVVLRLFAIPVILFLMWWNKKQQPDGPEEGYCLQRTRGRLIQLVWAALCLLVGAAGAAYLWANWTEAETGGEYITYIKMIVSGVIAVGGVIAAIYEAYTGLRDALCPEKSRLAKSIRAQLPYPDEAPPVKELFAMVDQDLRENGQWFGKLGIGKQWVLGDEVSAISRIRGVFGQNEWRVSHSGDRTNRTRIVQIWIVDNRQQQQIANLKTPEALEGAMDCLRQRAPAAVFGTYNSKEYEGLVYATEEEWYTKDREYRQRKAQLEDQKCQEQKEPVQIQVLTRPDGSVTSRITEDSLRQLLLQCYRGGETRPFQLVPGIPFQKEGHVYGRLICVPGSGQRSIQIILEEYPGSPGVHGTHGWRSDVSLSEAETILRGWLRGEIPSLGNWTPVKYNRNSWQSIESK